MSRSQHAALSPEEKLDRKRAINREKSKRHYEKNLEKSQKYQRDKQREYRQDPDKLAVIKARKRAGGAGLTPNQIAQIRDNQNNLCAICDDPDPTDLDHCHSTGDVRWLLCKHCNRGLGAFKDNPDLLKKAAMLLEARS